jgi:hypothetical protein
MKLKSSGTRISFSRWAGDINQDRKMVLRGSWLCVASSFSFNFSDISSAHVLKAAITALCAFSPRQ